MTSGDWTKNTEAIRFIGYFLIESHSLGPHGFSPPLLSLSYLTFSSLLVDLFCPHEYMANTAAQPTSVSFPG